MSGEFDPRITAYFGDAVLRAGFMPTPHLFLRHYAQLGLDSTHAMFLLQVMEIAWDLGDPPKTSQDFARRMGVGKKAIQRYTSHVEALGLINVFSQFDESGAQVENCYDLSPLFAKLAHFAPEPTPSGSLRRQQRRSGALAAAGARHATAQAAQTAGQTDPSTPGQIDPPPPGQLDPGGPDRFVAPGRDSAVQGGRIGRSGLKAEQRIPKEQQEQLLMYAESAATTEQASCDRRTAQSDQTGHTPIASRSLRWQHPRSTADIAQSDELLRRMQIDNPVRKLLADAYTPADLWAVRVYSLVKGWSPALTVSQLYDKSSKQPQLALELSAQQDAVGGRLAALAADQAEAVIMLVLRCCPQAAALQADPLMQQADPAVRAAIEAVWRMVAGLRGHAAPLSAAPAEHAPCDAPDHSMLQLWQTTLATLHAALPPADFATWLAPSMLLSLEREADAAHAVIGVPNIFAREQVLASYLTPLTQTLVALLGSPVTVQVEIDASISAPLTPGILPDPARAATSGRRATRPG
jgi:hypothetical protein